MTQHRKILNFIAAVRDSYPKAKDVYLNGGCYNFYLIIRIVYPQATAYYNGDHVAVMIDNKLYDITGVVCKKNYLPITKYFKGKNLSRNFKTMISYEQ